MEKEDEDARKTPGKSGGDSDSVAVKGPTEMEDCNVLAPARPGFPGGVGAVATKLRPKRGPWSVSEVVGDS